MASLSDAQLQQIADQIFIARAHETTRLSIPAESGPDSFAAALEPIRTHPAFQRLGVGVIDYTNDFEKPDIWLHHPEIPFRIGSASKIAVLLAAVQLRLDVRNILSLNIIQPEDFKKAFGDPRLWRKAKPPQRQMQQIAKTPPLISDIFDFGKNPVDFAGLDPDGRRDSNHKPVLAVQNAIRNRLPEPAEQDSLPELRWGDWSQFTFSDRLWMAGAMSDNVAASSCMSQIGQPYVKAVLRSYGLYDPGRGMHLFPSFRWGPGPPARSPPPRAFISAETVAVKDVNLRNGRDFVDQRSWVPGSAAALTAFMLALMGNGFGQPGASLIEHLAACETMIRNLADDGPNQVASFLVEGRNAQRGVRNPKTRISKQIHKIGLLQAPGEANFDTICEFVYLETEQVAPVPPNQRTFMKYAVIATGVLSDLGAGAQAGALEGAVKCAALGAFIHEALLKL